MNADRFDQITATYPRLRVAVVGDICLDRYLEIDPARPELSIETGLPVHNVVNVRSQPGAAGTILNNLVALEVGAIFPVSFCGEDGEGFELQRALRAKRGVQLDGFFATPERRTFTYCKPLVRHPGRAPQELSRLDSKNWSATPPAVEDRIITALKQLDLYADACLVFEDSPRGVQAAKAAGIRCIGVPDEGTESAALRDAGADLVLGSLREFSESLLRKWEELTV